MDVSCESPYIGYAQIPLDANVSVVNTATDSIIGEPMM